MGREAWRATVLGVAKSRKKLSKQCCFIVHVFFYSFLFSNITFVWFILSSGSFIFTAIKYSIVWLIPHLSDQFTYWWAFKLCIHQDVGYIQITVAWEKTFAFYLLEFCLYYTSCTTQPGWNLAWQDLHHVQCPVKWWGKSLRWIMQSLKTDLTQVPSVQILLP